MMWILPFQDAFCVFFNLFGSVTPPTRHPRAIKGEGVIVHFTVHYNLFIHTLISMYLEIYSAAAEF